MQSTKSQVDIEDRERALARIRSTAHPIRSVDELYGPGPGPDDPEDLEEFLSFLRELRQPVQPSDERNDD
jgi:hypothetical protein